MLKARLLTALCLVSGFLVVLFLLPGMWAYAAFAFIGALAVREWGNMVRLGKLAQAILPLLTLAACAMLWQQERACMMWLWSASLVFWGVVVPLWLREKWPIGHYSWFSGIGGMLMVLSAWAAMVALHQKSPVLLLGIMVLVWIADSAAYFVGRRIGRTKLAPVISPGKTWEGVAGGMAGVVISGWVLFSAYAQDIAAAPQLVLAGLLGFGILSVVGDLFESLAKRQAGIKDSGNILPGHGGVLDRIDSLLPTLPLAALFMDYAT